MTKCTVVIGWTLNQRRHWDNWNVSMRWGRDQYHGCTTVPNYVILLCSSKTLSLKERHIEVTVNKMLRYQKNFLENVCCKCTGVAKFFVHVLWACHGHCPPELLTAVAICIRPAETGVLTFATEWGKDHKPPPPFPYRQLNGANRFL